MPGLHRLLLSLGVHLHLGLAVQQTGREVDGENLSSSDHWQSRRPSIQLNGKFKQIYVKLFFRIVVHRNQTWIFLCRFSILAARRVPPLHQLHGAVCHGSAGAVGLQLHGGGADRGGGAVGGTQQGGPQGGPQSRWVIVINSL